MKRTLYPEQELKKRAMHWAVKLRVNPRSIRIQNMPNKWGSCSSAGTITLADDLVDKEKKFQDFVIVHELLHLRVATHNKLFKALMTAHVPYWRELDLENGAAGGTTKVCEGQQKYIACSTRN
jgi:hypothetical protein